MSGIIGLVRSFVSSRLPATAAEKATADQAKQNTIDLLVKTMQAQKDEFTAHNAAVRDIVGKLK